MIEITMVFWGKKKVVTVQALTKPTKRCQYKLVSVSTKPWSDKCLLGSEIFEFVLGLCSCIVWNKTAILRNGKCFSLDQNKLNELVYNKVGGSDKCLVDQEMVLCLVKPLSLSSWCWKNWTLHKTDSGAYLFRDIKNKALSQCHRKG